MSSSVCNWTLDYASMCSRFGKLWECALVELLVHARLFDNQRRVTAVPSASGFSRTLVVLLKLAEGLDILVTSGFCDHVKPLVLLKLHHVCHFPFSSFQSSVISILDTLNFLHHHNFVTLGRLLHSLTDGISCMSLTFSDCDLDLMILVE